MQLGQIITSSLAPIVINVLAFLLFITAFKLYRPKIVGWIGERKIQSILNKLHPKKYLCFHNVLLPIDGDTTQIDHIVFAGNTCFVIETKAHAGWIFGSADDKKWTQMLNKRSKFKFQNPLRQNYKHTLAVKNIIPDLKIESVVVFTSGEFKSKRIDGVLYPKELKSYLLKASNDASSHNMVAIQALKNKMILDKSDHREHVYKLQSKYGGKWQVPIANFLLLSGLMLLIFKGNIINIGIGKKSTEPVYSSTLKHSVPPSLQESHPVNVVVKKFKEPLKHTPPLPSISGFSEGMVVLSKTYNYKVLRVGKGAINGWSLESADSKGAVFLHTSGERVSVRSR